jgi:hypothetical protein
MDFAKQQFMQDAIEKVFPALDGEHQLIYDLTKVKTPQELADIAASDALYLHKTEAAYLSGAAADFQYQQGN